MYSMVIFVLNDVDYCPNLLEAWEDAGVVGITILESSGLGRVRNAGMRDDIPLMPSLSNLFKNIETQHRTIFTIVDNEDEIERIVKATESVVGDLEQSHTGFLFVLPVSHVYGRSKKG